MRGLLGIFLTTLLLIYILAILLIKIPLFEIKRVEVHGIMDKELKILEKEIHSLGRQLLFISEDVFLERINEIFMNRFKDIEIKRSFSTEGTIISINFYRRKAIAKVIKKNISTLLDNEGVIFYDENQNPLRTVYVRSKNQFETNKSKIIKLVNFAEKILVYKDKTEVYLKNKRIILPPLDYLSERKLILLKKFSLDNEKAKEVDMRYERIILLR
ncbi:MAG: hypothetical protein DSY42_03880 [Aquifex sp.]|nr:MAG: hypothetical protein DSY42_03880 [Aquifex sp.]